MLRKTELKEGLTYFSSFNIISYYIYSYLISSLLDPRLVDPVSTLIHVGASLSCGMHIVIKVDPGSTIFGSSKLLIKAV